MLAFDTETKGLNWFEPDEQAFLATWSGADYDKQAVLSDPDEVERFTAALDAETDSFVAHNASFDVHQTRATLQYDILDRVNEGVTLHDTDLMSRVLFPEGNRGSTGGHGLKNLAQTFLKHDAKDEEDAIKEMAKSIGLRTIKRKGAYYEVWKAYPDIMEAYARADSRYTYDLAQIFLPKLRADPQLWKLYQLEMAVCPVLIRAEARGTMLDREAVAELRDHYVPLRDSLERKLQEALGDEAIGGEGSDEALRVALLKNGVPLTETTPTGELSTNRFALAPFESEHEIVADLFAFRRAKKFVSSYLDALTGKDVVNPSFMQAEAWTGRMSCRRPSMQNLPKGADDGGAGVKMRSAFRARPGHKLVVCDYDSIEVKILAHYLGSDGQDYRDLLISGHDPHAYMASVLFGGVRQQYAKGTDGEELRSKAKNGMFAITYGAGGKRLTDMFGLDPGPWLEEDEAEQRRARSGSSFWPKAGWQYAEGRAMAKKIKDGIPGYWRLMKRVRTKIEESGHVTTYGGRRNPVDKKKAYVGLNALVQGSAADIMKAGLVEVANCLNPAVSVPLLVVHDEVVVETPEDQAEETLVIVKDALERAAELAVPLEVTGTIVDSYGEA